MEVRSNARTTILSNSPEVVIFLYTFTSGYRCDTEGVHAFETCSSLQVQFCTFSEQDAPCIH